ncbi:4502_t:CDS:1, partial [Gigaspora rosea]
MNEARESVADRLVTLRVAEAFDWDIAAALPSTQNNLLKGKETLIEKAKVLAEARRNKKLIPLLDDSIYG